jgi:hypothetical protein
MGTVQGSRNAIKAEEEARGARTRREQISWENCGLEKEKYFCEASR